MTHKALSIPSIAEYKSLYHRLNVEFDVYSGESMFRYENILPLHGKYVLIFCFLFIVTVKEWYRP